jgi:hypothetical protein
MINVRVHNDKTLSKAHGFGGARATLCDIVRYKPVEDILARLDLLIAQTIREKGR